MDRSGLINAHAAIFDPAGNLLRGGYMSKQPWRRQLLLATMGLIALLLIGGTLSLQSSGFLDPFLVFSCMKI